MQGFADALLEDYSAGLDATAQDYARRIVTASKRMDTLIQDLLIYSRLNRSDLQLEPVLLDVVLNDALIQLENEVKSKNATVEIIQPLPAVCAHQGTLIQVCTNLISNALKFVTPGTIPHVKIWAETSQELSKFYFQDNGIGIAEEYHTRIFRVFERLHGVEAYPGTGIGLAIVRKGMERMNGRASLVSEPGKGSMFWIELPATVPC
jgi:light-regulated signal transduction histidine kinase (bacteriophytochrome)